MTDILTGYKKQSNQIKIKVISDGTIIGTKIIDEETGNIIPNCTYMMIEFSARDKFARCSILLSEVPVEFVGDVNDIKNK